MLKSSRLADGRITEEWIQRVVCCAPHASARALTKAFNLAVGSDAPLVARPSIGKVRDAWVDIYKERIMAATGAAIAGERAATGAAGRNFWLSLGSTARMRPTRVSSAVTLGMAPESSDDSAHPRSRTTA